MRAPLLFLLLAASGCILGSTRCAKETTIELLSAPIKLRYGQVHNTWQEPIDLPDDVVKKFENGTMALVDYMIDIVYENGSRVPLYDTYNHHVRLGKLREDRGERERERERERKEIESRFATKRKTKRFLRFLFYHIHHG